MIEFVMYSCMKEKNCCTALTYSEDRLSTELQYLRRLSQLGWAGCFRSWAGTRLEFKPLKMSFIQKD